MRKIHPSKIRIGQLYKVIMKSKTDELILIERKIKRVKPIPKNCVWGITLYSNNEERIDVGAIGYVPYTKREQKHTFYSLNKGEAFLELL